MTPSSTRGACRSHGSPCSRTRNDLARGRYLVDRCGDILEAAGGKDVTRVYADKVTGNRSHQHGTARTGDDPETSVTDRNCRAHEVDNPHVVDGSPFPTATGANPTLTIMANARRGAEHIATRAGQGA
jgi:choline dehydrogenase-like flavoprotein